MSRPLGGDYSPDSEMETEYFGKAAKILNHTNHYSISMAKHCITNPNLNPKILEDFYQSQKKAHACRQMCRENAGTMQQSSCWIEPFQVERKTAIVPEELDVTVGCTKFKIELVN